MNLETNDPGPAIPARRRLHMRWRDVRRALYVALTAVPLTPVRFARRTRYHASADSKALVHSPQAGESRHER